jgi:hypothetical protein
MGTYPDPNNQISQQKFPGDSNKDMGTAPEPRRRQAFQNTRFKKSNSSSTRRVGLSHMSPTALTALLVLVDNYAL